MKMFRSLSLVVAAAALLSLTACASIYDKSEPVAPIVDIVDTAVAAGSFETLVAAVSAAGLVDTLKGDGPFTVFAPTDEAFAKLPEGTVESLLEPANKDKLVAILTYHVVPGKIMSVEIAGQALDVATVNGEMVEVDATSDVMVNKARVTTADVVALNGVIHVIDTVLIPE